MSDQMAAEIWIGGRLPAALVPGLCEAICGEHVGLEWDCNNFKPKSAQDLLDACEDEGDGVKLLHLYDYEARWGQFEGLECFLREHRMAYTRHSDGKHEFTAEVAEHRPKEGLFVFAADPQHEPYVLACQLGDVDKTLTEAVKHLERGAVGPALQAAQQAQGLLRQQLPPTLPPLEPFAIDPEP